MDDNLLFSAATLKEASQLNIILEDFQEASGMLLNKLNSDIYFFNTPRPVQACLARTLGFNVGSLPSKYLGVPLLFNPLRIV